jgi:hypothetical protein
MATKAPVAVARDILAAIPDGTKFHATTWRTQAGGVHADAARSRLMALEDELRDANRDPKVKSVTVVVIYGDA